MAGSPGYGMLAGERRVFADEDLETSLPHCFERQARATPGRLAVAGARHRFTYDELNREANRIAHALMDCVPSLAEPARVALWLDHDAPAIAAALGVLKAGLAYVALDPADPEARRRQILGASEPAVLLTDASRLSAARALVGPGVRVLDMGALASHSTQNPERAIDPGALAMILFTSGSTGHPKGVMRSHRMLLHGARNPINIFRISSGDRLAQLATLSTGQGVTPVFASLFAGASLHMFSLKTEGVARLAAWVRDEQITIYHSTTIVLRYLGRMLESTVRFPSVRVVRVGGEPCLREDLEIYRRHVEPHARFVNAFSMTETGSLTMEFMSHGTPVDADLLPVGLPVPDKPIAIVDGDLQPLPVGEVGEITVRSRYIALGYWRDAEQTRRRFVPQPDGTVMCRTGDLGRLRPDGRLEYLGRLDLQVKIRGYRVEVEEVEAALGRHPAIRAAAVTLRKDVAGNSVLTAHVVWKGADRPGALALRTFLLQTVPDHFVPAHFVPIAAMPLTPSGKIDRRALPAEPIQPAPRAYTVPRTDVERRLALVWSRTLNQAAVGVDEDFFALGGDSLRAAQMLWAVHLEFGQEIPLRAFLDHSTIEGLVGLVGNSATRPSAIPRRAAPGPAPLSLAQQRLWLVDRLTPGNPAYGIARAFQLTGPIDEPALRGALDALVQRHAALRTTFHVTDHQPVQIVSVEAQAEFMTMDLSTLREIDRAAELERLLLIEANRAFDLSRDVLLRAWLARVDAETHVLLLVNHHIASDAWSAEILTRELSALYGAFIEGRPSPLPPLPIEYADFAVWQRQQLTVGAVATQLAYWTDRLRGAPEILAWPPDRPRPAVQSFRGARRRVGWSAATTSRLEAIARDEQATLFMVLLAAFQVFLHRYTGEDDVVVGSPVTGRVRAEVQGLVGFFANTLVFRTSVAGDPTFREVLRRVRAVAFGAYEHQDLPFERLVEELRPERGRDHSPIAQVYLGLHDASVDRLVLPGLTVRPLDFDPGTAKFDLTISLGRSASGLSGYLEYSLDLFDADTAARMAAHFDTLVTAVAADPDRAIAALPLMSGEERTRLLVEAFVPGRDLPAGASLASLFADRATASPDAVAITAPEGSLTYAELLDRARRVASRLRRLGVGPDVRVAIFMERSLELVVAMLGIIEAGGAYVPLDPGYPRTRLAFMLRDADVRVALVQSRLSGTLAGSDGAPVIVILEPGGLLPDEGALDAGAGVAPGGADSPAAESLAYVMYTSGSTGVPKGVAVPQRAVARLVLAPNYLELTPHDVVAQISSVSFDAATFEIWGALLNGARLVVFPRSAILSPRVFADGLEGHGVTALFVTAALFHRVAAETPSAFATVRHLLVGGASPDPAAVRRVLAAGRPGRLLNMYGPTEATTFASWHQVDEVREGETAIPIGRPISGTELVILDRSGEPVPAGVVGEIHLGGPGLARGYLGRPELTVASFVAHPLRPGDRLFRTGDRGFYRADGAVVFVGRLDDQVKIRGFRVEPGEVESILGRHPGVRQSVVVSRPGPDGERQLIAYVGRAPGQAPPARELRAFLSGRLPEFMVPSAFVVLDAVPVTPNGKVDRAALPAPEASRAAAWVPPSGDLERRVAAVWRSALAIDRVGRDDNFFELGGHSLLAIQVALRLDRELRRTVSGQWLFEYPTLASFAERIEREPAGRAAPVRPRPRGTDRLPASAIQQDAWLRREVHPPDSGFMVVRTFDVIGDLDVPALEASLTDLVARHEVLRTGLTGESGRVFQIVHPPYPVAVGLERPVDDAGAEAVRRTFHMTRGPWIRASVIDLGPHRHRLLLSLPHVVYDAWALDVLYRELEILYAAHRRGIAPALQRPGLQYADYVLWAQQAALDDGSLLDYWRVRLAGVPSLRLPMWRPTLARRLLRQATRLRSLPGTDGPRMGEWLLRAGALARRALKPARAGRAVPSPGRFAIELPAGLVSSLRALARSEEVTLFVTLLAAFKAVLADAAGQTDVTVAVFISNRNRPELQDVVGNLGNTLALRSSVGRQESFRDLVRRVGAGLFEAQTHADVPFAAVSRALTRPGELPLEYRIPAVFQLIERLRSAPRLDGVDVSAGQTASRHRSLRLAVTLHEHGDGLSGTCSFDAGLYDSAGCRMLLARFVGVLVAAAEDPDRPVPAILETAR